MATIALCLHEVNAHLLVCIVVTQHAGVEMLLPPELAAVFLCSTKVVELCLRLEDGLPRFAAANLLPDDVERSEYWKGGLELDR